MLQVPHVEGVGCRVAWLALLLVVSATQPEIFQSRRGFVELGHFDKLSSKTQEKHFGAFFPRNSWNHILNRRFNPRMETIRAFFQNQGTFFNFQKRALEPSSPSLPSCASEHKHFDKYLRKYLKLNSFKMYDTHQVLRLFPLFCESC